MSVFYKIQQKIPSKLLLVGEGPDREHLELQAKELGILDKVLFLGNSNEVNKLLCYSDLFLLPSETESFGLAALEAMASGVPVISSNTGGIPEVNKHGVSGFLSNVGDINEMTKNALKILTDEAVLKQFKENAYTESKQFDIHTIVPYYENIYRQALTRCVSL
jgi:N-acetyl-alpha-D-glucosaminyl L-malate synthase BshA